jgi:hypothetical protein
MAKTERYLAVSLAKEWAAIFVRLEPQIKALDAAISAKKATGYVPTAAEIDAMGLGAINRALASEGLSWAMVSADRLDKHRAASVYEAIERAQQKAGVHAVAASKLQMATSKENIAKSVIARQAPVDTYLRKELSATMARLNRDVVAAGTNMNSRKSIRDIVMSKIGAMAAKTYTVAATETLSAMREAEIETWRGSDNDVTGWVWIAEDDCCAGCAIMANTVHNMDEELDSHPNCRCYMEPIKIDDFPTINDSAKLDLDDLKGLEQRLGNKQLAKALHTRAIKPIDAAVYDAKGRLIGQASHIQALQNMANRKAGQGVKLDSLAAPFRPRLPGSPVPPGTPPRWRQ